MRFELYVAARYLKAKRRQAVVGVVTAISIAGVAAGVAALIIALAITNGMRRDLQDRLLDSSAHVQLMRVEGRRHPRLASAARAPAPSCRMSSPPRPNSYEQVMVARGARDGCALIEGILPDTRTDRQRLFSTAHARLAVNALEPQPDSAAPSAQRTCRPSSSAKIWQTPSAPLSAIRSC